MRSSEPILWCNRYPCLQNLDCNNYPHIFLFSRNNLTSNKIFQTCKLLQRNFSLDSDIYMHWKKGKYFTVFFYGKKKQSQSNEIKKECDKNLETQNQVFSIPFGKSEICQCAKKN